MQFKKVIKLTAMFLLLFFCTITVSAAEFDGEKLVPTNTESINKLSQILGLDNKYTEEFLESLGIYLKDEAKLESYNDLEARTVIVMLDGESLYDIYTNDYTIQKEFTSFSEYALSEKSYEVVEDIEKVHANLFNALADDKINYELKYTYSSIFNGVSIYIDTDDIETISNYSFVEEVIYSETYAAPEAEAVMNNVEVYTTGIYDTSDISYTGKGMLVAVLDTGIDYKHNAFQNMPVDPRVSYGDVEEKLESFVSYTSTTGSITIDDVYYNSKIPYAYDYADGDSDVFPTANVHGVHVAGIIAGKDDTVTEEDHEVFANGEKFLGVAPDAQLAIMKVFSDYDDGAESDSLLAALSDCVTLGVDVINMSLGSSAGFAREVDEVAVNKVYDKIRETGISLVVAAGNSYSSALGGAYGTTNLAKNPDSGTVSSPSTYDAAISVASVSGQLTSYFLANNTTAVYFNESSSITGDKYDFVTEMLKGESSKTFNYVVVGGYGKEFNYTPAIRAELSNGNTIAVVKRGDISFEDKQKIASDYGAVGCIIYNNVSGTISASLGNGKVIPTCTISMDMASQFVDSTTGTITISSVNKAGPFMSDFSSWGPTADLELKPEITAHGGEIISAVVGGYDEFSGTSMACPNLAGVTALLRQYVKETKYDITKGNINDIADLVYQLLMSTATIIYNNEGNPYSPRKQGAGLADISKAMATDAYLYVEGTNKTKLSLGDDKSKTGEYTLRFNLKNMSDVVKTYIPETLTMTESLSSDGITVAEKAYMLNNGKVTYKVSGGARLEDGVIYLQPNGDAEIEVTIRLSNEEKQYLDENFENGMYVEGFVTLKDYSEGTTVDLNIPWLAFYGDWLQAPVFDASSFEVSDSYFDDKVDEEDKLIAAVYETTPIGKYYNGTYYMPLGEYIFVQEDGAEQIKKSTDKVALSSSPYAMHELYAVYAGLLRSAKAMKVEIIDVISGKVIYDEIDYNIRKSYGAGSGSSYPGAALMELTPADLGLANNTQYKVSLTASLDYQNGELCNNNTYEFYFWIDFEVPTIVNYEYRYKYNKDNERTVTMDLEIYDNHYAQALQLFVVNDSGSISMLTEYPVPIDSSRGGTSKVSIDITDYVDACQNSQTYPGQIGVYLYDYALNAGGYLIPLTYNEVEDIEVSASGTNVEKTQLYKQSTDVLKYSKFTTRSKKDYITFVYSENDLDLSSVVKATINGEETSYTIDDGEVTLQIESRNLDKYELALYNASDEVITSATHYQKVDLTTTIVELEVGDVFKFDVNLIGGDEETELLIDDVGVHLDRDNYITVKGTEILGKLVGSTTVTIYSKTDGNIYKQFKVIVIGRETESPSYKLEKLTISSYTDQATGVNIGVRDGVINLDCGSIIKLVCETQPWYATDVNITWESTNEDLAIVDENGKVTCLHSGTVDILAKAQVGTLPLTTYVTLVIDEEYTVLSGYLYEYNGAGGEDGVRLGDEIVDNALVIPADLGAIYLGHYSDGVAGPFYTLADTKIVVVPEGITSLGYYSFAYSDIETIFLPSTLESIGTETFLGCSFLKNIYWIEEAEWNSELGEYTKFEYTTECTAKNLTIGPRAFAYNYRLTSIDLTKTTAILDYGFYYCQKLEEVNISNLRYAGTNVFANCNTLKNVISDVETTYGDYMFWQCSALTEFDYYDSKVYSNMFYNCKKLQKVEFFSDLSMIDTYAFQNCSSLNTIEFNGHTCGSIENQAFNGCTSLSSFYIPNGVKSIGNYVFWDCSMLTSISLGNTVNFEYIGINTFYGCDALKGFHLPYGSAYYSVKQVVDEAGNKYDFLYSLDGTKIIFSAPAYQYQDKVDDKEYTQEEIYNFYDEDGNLYSSVISQYAYSQKAITDAKELDVLVIPEGITHIGAGAFFNNAIKKVILPTTLETIDEYAFYGCRQLVEVVFQSDIKRIERYTFYNCQSLTTIELPASLEYIGKNAFRLNRVLTYIEIPASVTLIDDFAFMDNSMLETVEFENGSLLEQINLRAFANCTALVNIELPDNLVTLGNSVFENCYTLESITIPGSVRNWGDFLFAFCASLEKVVIEEGVEYIGYGAFMFYSSLQGSEIYYNTALKEVVVPNSVTQIAPYAFCAAMYLEKIDLPNVTAIHDYAFMGCEALTDVTLGAETVEYIGVSSFYASAIQNINLENVELINAGAFYNCVNLTKVDMPKLEQLGAQAFYGCTSLTSANLPNCEDIYAVAFGNCIALEELNIDNAKVIGEGAFFGCAELDEVTLSSEIEDIYSVVFAGCLSLKEIKLAGESETYFTDESGVLYKVLKTGGYELVAYPGGNTQTNYSILEGTRRVASWAFGYCYYLTSIDIAATVESIGSYAFYGVGLGGSTINITYNFKGLQAPRLEGDYVEDATSIVYFYANFSYNIGYVQTNVSIPANGIGYDSYIFDVYFTDPVYSSPVMEKTTQDIYNLIEKLAGLTTLTEQDVKDFYQVKQSLDYLNNVQKALVTNSYKLIDIYDKVLELENSSDNIETPDEPNEPEVPSDPGTTDDPIQVKPGTEEGIGKYLIVGIISGLVAATAAILVLKLGKKGGKNNE